MQHVPCLCARAHAKQEKNAHFKPSGPSEYSEGSTLLRLLTGRMSFLNPGKPSARAGSSATLRAQMPPSTATTSRLPTLRTAHVHTLLVNTFSVGCFQLHPSAEQRKQIPQHCRRDSLGTSISESAALAQRYSACFHIESCIIHSPLHIAKPITPGLGADRAPHATSLAGRLP